MNRSRADRALFVVNPGGVACSRAGECGRCSPASRSVLPAPGARARAGSTWTPAALRLVCRLAGAGRGVGMACWWGADLGLVVTREWLVRRAGVSDDLHTKHPYVRACP